MKYLMWTSFLVASISACAGAIPRESSEDLLPRAEAESSSTIPQTASSTAPEEGVPQSTLPPDDANARASTPANVEAAQNSRRILQGPSKTWEERTETAEGLTLYLCSILMRGDKDGFQDVLHSESPRDAMRYWWNASSKARYFTKLFDKCTFDNLDRRNSNADHLKIYVKRWVKKLDRYTLPAPIRFRRDPKARGSWRLISYSL